MATGVVTWSQTANTNATADANVNYAEGQAPSSLNDSARAAMASVAKWRDDITGVNVTGGSGTAYTLSSNQLFGSNTTGYTIQFTPGSTNTGAVTLSIDSNTAQPLRFLTGVDLPSGVLISGSLYQATYRSASSEWLLHASPLAQPFLIPIGAIVDYTGTTAPNSNFVIPAGQAISRTTFAAYFAIVSTTFGTGDGSTTFNVPDLGGRVVVMKEASATRLTTAGSGVDGGTLGASGGAQNITMARANLPQTSVSVTITDPGHGHPGSVGQTQGTNLFNVVTAAAPGSNNTGTNNSQLLTIANNTTNISAAFNLNGNVSQTAMIVAQPTIVLNKILRVI